MRKIFFLFPFYATMFGQENRNDTITSKTQNLKEVIVSATRDERQFSSIPLPAVLIKKEEIKNSGSSRLIDVLVEQAGIISVPDFTVGGEEGIQIQGISSDYITVLIDGAPLIGRNSGNFDLSRISVNNIKQIEVVKGPSSSLFGSDALGGVINIVTNKILPEKLSGEISHQQGSFGLTDSNLSIGKKKSKFGYSLFINRFSTSGYDLSSELPGKTVDPYKNWTLQPRLFYDFSEKIKLIQSFRYFSQKQNIYNGDSEEEDFNFHTLINQEIAKNWKAKYEIYSTRYNAFQVLNLSGEPSNFEKTTFDQKLFKPEFRLNYKPSSNKNMMMGVGGASESLERTLFKEKVKFNSKYAFIQYDFFPSKKLNLIVGMRYDQHSEYNSELSPKISFKYNVTDHLSIKGSAGSGFKAPDFRQLYLDYTNSTVGYTVLGKTVEKKGISLLEENSQLLNIIVPINDLGGSLKAESSSGYNFSLSHEKKALFTEINLFRNDIKNLIDTRILARKINGQNVFGYQNLNSIFTQGIELSSHYKGFKNITISIGYQLLYSYDKEKLSLISKNEVYSRDPETLSSFLIAKRNYFGLANRSRHSSSFKIFYSSTNKKTKINLRLNYRSKYAMYDTNGNDLIDNYDSSFVKGFSLVNTSVTQDLSDKLAIQTGSRNILNHKDASALPNLSGRQFYINLNYNF
ncbi:MAG: TonB-dependent receptor [Bacteroidota bacterium]|nr:TonB-dependent receptor [Bacteroidota bacterium]